MENNGKMIFTINTLEGVMECNDRNSSRWLEEINDILYEVEVAVSCIMTTCFKFMPYIKHGDIAFENMYLELIEIESGKKSLIIYCKEEREKMLEMFNNLHEKIKENKALDSSTYKEYRNRLKIRDYIDIWTCNSILYTLLLDEGSIPSYFGYEQEKIKENIPKRKRTKYMMSTSGESYYEAEICMQEYEYEVVKRVITELMDKAKEECCDEYYGEVHIWKVEE